MTALKVCCIQDRAELELAARAGATFVGLVAEMPSGPGPLPDARIRALVEATPAPVVPVLLTARDTVDGLVDHLRETGIAARLDAGLPAAVQLVRHHAPPLRAALRARAPSLTVIQVLHVEDESALEVVADLAARAHHLLLDSGSPARAVLGGTGRTHDWALSRRIVARAPVPVLLAGGLRPGNVARAVEEVAPWGVDVCSGLRDAAGALVPARLEAFVAALAAGSEGEGRGEAS